ncbi:efflux RND transporter permease subunit [Maioricimonas sp. JC845]|uniref:efflux RND transporter permease subunit n=1 Tax=Maioricimonas sp. JC845 TaxID=3232138 RepID=UPI00345A2CEF
MKSLVRWAIGHSPAMNMLMVSILAIGALSAFMLRRETFPRFELEIILVQVPYPGASPEEVENGICQKIEEAIQGIDGLKKVTSVATEGAGNVVIELRSDVKNVQKILNEVEAEVDRIPSFPELAEEPEIQQLTIRNPAIKLGVVGPDLDTPDAELKLREIAERVRDDLLQLDEISVAEIQGAKDYQIDVEISEETLRKYGLTLQEVANRIRMQNLEMPAGNIKTASQEFLLRGKNKRLRGEEIAEIPLVTSPSGVTLTVGDLGTVQDEFADATFISRVNGKPGMAISVESAAREDLLAMTEAVRNYAETTELPPGYEFVTWDDRSIDVRDRLDMLINNGLQGLVLVFLVLALFLELRLSFWVALGIPVSVLGACAVLWQFDQTLNMLSMFAFLIALGIVVDDAIVIGENIYSHREMGKPFLQAAIDGTIEVLPSVAASVSTTVIAFVPMFFVTGVMGKFFAVMPMAVIAMLVISLIESSLILPCHLAHGSDEEKAQSLTARALAWRTRHRRVLARWIVGPSMVVLAFIGDQLSFPFRRIGAGIHWINEHFSSLLDWVIQKLYVPTLRFSIHNPAIVFAAAASIFLLSIGLVTNGTVPWVFFPKLDSRQIEATVVFPDGTPSHVTDEATKRLEQAILEVNREYEKRGEPIVRLTHRLVGQVSSESPGGPAETTSGGHAGSVRVELVDNTERSVTSQQVVDQWRNATGQIAGAESISFGSVGMGPGGAAIEFKLLAPAEHMADLEDAIEACKAKLARYPGVFDISDDSRPGKWEYQLSVHDRAHSLGVPLDVLARKVRAAYYGDEVMRLQRGRHEVKLMVRYPQEERRSLANFNDMYIDTGDGAKRPLSELADVKVQRGYSEINRIEQKRSITLTADVDESTAVASDIIRDLRSNFMPELLAEYPNIRVRWEGQQEQSQESVQSLFVGLLVALLAMFALLTLEFNSYLQPAIIMAVIPFGAIGALLGHAAMGLPLTLFSVLGLVALTGVVVNDSIVLVDFINHQLKEGVPLSEAVMQSGQRRFRPVLLTSMTTVAGLLPILTEKSFQAQILIPMANSLCFGLMLSTALVLILVPTFYSVYGRFTIGHIHGTLDTTGHDEMQALARADRDAENNADREAKAEAASNNGQREAEPALVQERV